MEETKKKEVNNNQEKNEININTLLYSCLPSVLNPLINIIKSYEDYTLISHNL